MNILDILKMLQQIHMKKTMSSPIYNQEWHRFGQKNSTPIMNADGDNDIEKLYWMQSKTGSGYKPNSDLIPMAALGIARRSFSIMPEPITHR